MRGEENLGDVNIRRGIFQDDSLSPFTYCGSSEVLYK